MDEWRGAQIERLRSRRFDLLVVGGGIVGAGVAGPAARHGFAVLIEADDFGSGTSSASAVRARVEALLRT
jgi:glycerol-3-phosphate dehydrogenase